MLFPKINRTSIGLPSLDDLPTYGTHPHYSRSEKYQNMWMPTIGTFFPSSPSSPSSSSLSSYLSSSSLSLSGFSSSSGGARGSPSRENPFRPHSPTFRESNQGTPSRCNKSWTLRTLLETNESDFHFRDKIPREPLLRNVIR